MSEKSSQKNEKIITSEKEEGSKEESQKENEKEEKIDPLSLLSKDLLEKINSLEEIDFEDKDKKERITDGIQLDETQKESEANDEEEDYILEVEKEMDKDIFSIDIFKNEENEKSTESKNLKKEDKNQGRFSQPIPIPQNIMNFGPNQIEDFNYGFQIGRLSYDSPQFQNKNDSFNIRFNNPLQNQFNFFNNSFTMNGKSGWVCALCKNFNYESKFIHLFNILLFYFIKNSKNKMQ